MRGCPLRAGAGRRRGYAGRYDDSRRCDAYSGRAEINIVCRPSGRVVGPAVAQACFFCRRTPLSCLSSPHRSLPRLSSRLPFFSCRPAFPTARVSLCPCLPLPASRQLCRAVLLRLYSVWFFFCHFLFFRSSSIARRLLSVARCAVHRPALAACCPSPVPPRLFPLPFGPDHGFCIRGIPACVSSGAACRVGFRRSVFPQKCPPPPYLGRRAVSDKITPCILLSGAIFPARPAILLTIWQRLPFGTTFVQIQGVTGAPDPQGGRIPAARKENGKNINN